VNGIRGLEVRYAERVKPGCRGFGFGGRPGRGHCQVGLATSRSACRSCPLEQHFEIGVTHPSIPALGRQANVSHCFLFSPNSRKLFSPSSFVIIIVAEIRSPSAWFCNPKYMLQPSSTLLHSSCDSFLSLPHALVLHQAPAAASLSCSLCAASAWWIGIRTNV
jgi:hypothetical protein